MKINASAYLNKRILSNIIIIFASITFYFLVANISKVVEWVGRFLGYLSPFFFGLIIAYLLSGPVDFFDCRLRKRIFKKHKKQRRLSRIAAVITVVTAVMAILILMFYFMIPQLLRSLTMFTENMPGYIEALSEVAERFNIKDDFLNIINGGWRDNMFKVSDYISQQLPAVYDFFKSLTYGLFNFFLGFVISIYLIADKERFAAQFKMILFAIFPNAVVTALVRVGRYTDDTFGKYITGKLLVSLVLGILSFLTMLVFRMEYALLISFIIAVTNIIPFFGGIFGAVAGGFIMLMADASKVVWLIIMITVLQQLDGIVLSPFIVGRSLKLPAIWVIFAIIISGAYFGIIGILLSVPVFSVAYVLIKSLIEKRLEDKKLPISTGSYNSCDFPL